MPEIQDEVRPKSLAPPPTAQTAGPNWLKFFLEAPLVDAFRITEAIFVFHSRSRDIGAAPSHPRDPLGVKKCQKIFFFKTNFFRHDRYLWCLKRPQQPFFRHFSPFLAWIIDFSWLMHFSGIKSRIRTWTKPYALYWIKTSYLMTTKF